MSAQHVRKFVGFHRANPDVYALFKRFAEEAMAAGHTRFSSDAILHRIRWETNVATRGAGWSTHTGRPLKINDHFSAYYSRLYIMEHPQHAGFFQFRDAS